MPIFEYTCRNCGNRFEKIHTATGKAGVACPRCGSGDVGREFSTFSAGTSAAAAAAASCFSGG